eukprot:3509448-Prymnesium_polylepis.1
MVKFALDGGTVDESSGEFDNRKAAYTQLRLKCVTPADRCARVPHLVATLPLLPIAILRAKAPG